EYPPPRAVMPQLPQPLEAVIVRAMNVDPAQRFPSVRHFAAALLRFASDGARVLWSDTFRVDETPRASNVEAGYTRPLPAAAVAAAQGSVSGTQLLPSSEPRVLSSSRGTTLGAATGQRLDLQPPRRGRAGLLIAGLLSVAVGGGAVLALRMRPEPPPGASATTTAAAPAAPASYR